MKKSLILGLALVALTVFAGLSAGQQAPTQWPTSGLSFSGTLVCKRPATPAHNTGVDRCHGNWLPTDNTGKFDYQAAPGPDHFNKTSWPKADRRCEKCPNGGTIKQDFNGNEDWCVNYVAATSAATATPSCPSGFSWNGMSCTRPASPADTIGVDRCHGNWLPTDNTGKFDYQAAPGPDHFNKTSWPKADRRCEKCPNGGTIKQDFKGNEDWCVNYVAATSAATTTPSCPSGFTLGPP